MSQINEIVLTHFLKILYYIVAFSTIFVGASVRFRYKRFGLLAIIPLAVIDVIKIQSNTNTVIPWLFIAYSFGYLLGLALQIILGIP